MSGVKHGRVFRAGLVIDGCELLSCVGEGPFGVVWRVRDSKRTQPLVLKLLKPQLLAQPHGRTSIQRLVSSFRAYSELEHPCVCPVLRVVQDQIQNAYGTLSPWISGHNLTQTPPLRPSPHGQLDGERLSQVVEWFEQTCEILEWLHARGFVHGNLKPTNLMKPAQDRMVILDLSWSSIGVAMPVSGAVSYLPPEQLSGQAPTVLSDQYSVMAILKGVLAQEALTFKDGVPERLVALLERATSVSPQAGFPSMQGVRAELFAIRQRWMTVPAMSPSPRLAAPTRGDDFQVDISNEPELDLASIDLPVEVDAERNGPRARESWSIGPVIGALVVLGLVALAGGAVMFHASPLPFVAARSFDAGAILSLSPDAASSPLVAAPAAHTASVSLGVHTSSVDARLNRETDEAIKHLDTLERRTSSTGTTGTATTIHPNIVPLRSRNN